MSCRKHSFEPDARPRMSRRAFAQSLLFGALGVTLAPPAVAQENRNSDALWDVVVVGSGMAGLCAAISARESGARRVIILEKGPLIGGHSLYSSGSIAAVAPERAAPGSAFADSPEAFVADALRAGGGTGNRRILARIAAESGDALNWLEGMGVRFGRPFQAHSGLNPRSFSMRGNSAGRSYILALAARAQALGIPFAMHARAEGLTRISTNSGKLWRISASSQGKRRSYAARRVVLATGGFSANIALRTRILPMLTADVGTSANPDGACWEGADGDGIALAEEAGGVFLEGFGLQLLPYWGGRLLDYAGGDIYVDAAGRRFVDEALPWTPIAEKILALPGKVFWVITDRQSIKGATLGLKLLNGSVRKADSIAEMADAMQVSSDVLAATLAEYNAAVKKGFDPVTGKTTFTQTIDSPPFYFGREHIYVHTTLDGIATDDAARVLDRSGKPIENLFAAGELAGGIFGRDRLGGAGLANCLVMGREAGRFQAGHRR